jgi:hypothetical protein
VVGFVCDGLVDAAEGDSPGSCVEVDVLSIDVPLVDVVGPRLASEPVPLLDEPVPLLDEEEPLGLSEPVLSA